MKVLITGSRGFVGKHLMTYLLQRGHNVIGGVSTANIQMEKNEVTLDVTKPSEIVSILNNLAPDVVIHLAAQSNVGKAWDNPSQTYLINTIGTINLVQAIAEFKPETKLIAVGSSEEYGLTAKTCRSLTEQSICLPQNPYASSKYAGYMNIEQLAKKYNINYSYIRPFNHIGPGQEKGFVVSDFASQIADIEKGKTEPVIKVGNTDVYRDFLDVRDVVNAYTIITEKHTENGIYNVASGIARKIEDILNILISFAVTEIRVEIDENKFRLAEVKSFSGNSNKLRNSVDWKPEFDIEETLLDTLNWWRKKL